MELSKEQQKIIDCNDDKIIVMSSAASGKTRLISEYTHKLLRTGVPPENIAVMTFTKAAAGEMRERIGDYQNLFVGTIHSLAYRWMADGGYVKEADSHAGDEDFDFFFKFLLENYQLIKYKDYLIIDEAQDCDKKMWKIFLEYIKPKHLFIVGDIRQNIYEFRGVTPEIFIDLMNNKEFTVFNLNENYRNSKRILDFAKKYSIDVFDNSKPMRDTDGVIQVIKGASEYEFKKLMPLMQNEYYGDWLVLGRSNSHVKMLQRVLTTYNIPNLALQVKGKTNIELHNILTENKILVGTIHSAKGLERKKVLIYGVNYDIADKYDKPENRVKYVAATRARDVLIWMIGDKWRK